MRCYQPSQMVIMVTQHDPSSVMRCKRSDCERNYHNGPIHSDFLSGCRALKPKVCFCFGSGLDLSCDTVAAFAKCKLKLRSTFLAEIT